MKSTFKFLIGLITLALFSFATSSCTKPGDDVDNNNIVGKWKLVKTLDQHYSDGELTNSIENNCTDWWRVLEFKADGTGYETQYTEGVEGTPISYPLIWTIEGSNLIISKDRQAEHWDLEKLNNKTLIISITFEQEIYGCGIDKMYYGETYERI